MKETAEALRGRILTGAIALFIERGVERVTTRELTERLGISRSHIYHYFRDWETLCREAMTQFMREDEADFTARLQGLNAHARLMAFVSDYLPAEPHASWTLYSSLWQLAIHDAEWAEMAQTLMTRWHEIMADIIRAGLAAGEFRHGDPEQITRQLSAMVNGYAEQLIVVPSPLKHRAASEDIAAFIALALRPVG